MTYSVLDPPERKFAHGGKRPEAWLMPRRGLFRVRKFAAEGDQPNTIIVYAVISKFRNLRNARREVEQNLPYGIYQGDKSVVCAFL